MQLLNEQLGNLVGKNKSALRSDLPQDCHKGVSTTAGERTSRGGGKAGEDICLNSSSCLVLSNTGGAPAQEWSCVPVRGNISTVVKKLQSRLQGKTWPLILKSSSCVKRWINNRYFCLTLLFSLPHSGTAAFSKSGFKNLVTTFLSLDMFRHWQKITL